MYMAFLVQAKESLLLFLEHSVYCCAPEDMIPVGSLDTPVNAHMLISGSSTFDLIKVLPDVGAIAAFAGSDD